MIKMQIALILLAHTDVNVARVTKEVENLVQHCKFFPFACNDLQLSKSTLQSFYALCLVNLSPAVVAIFFLSAATFPLS